jgi:hypothetical protein
MIVLHSKQGMTELRAGDGIAYRAGDRTVLFRRGSDQILFELKKDRAMTAAEFSELAVFVASLAGLQLSELCSTTPELIHFFKK